MIYVRLRGRAGNQLFIYAFARNLSLITEQPVTICTRIDNKKDIKFSKFQNDLSEFNISPDVKFDDSFKFPWFANNDFFITKIFRKLAPSIFFKIMSKFNVFLWFEETFKKVSIETKNDAFLDGFWQCESYFADNFQKIVCNELTMKKKLSERNQFLYNEIKNNESVCVTIRRGDYCSDEKVKRNYYVCDEKYFEKSIKRILELRPNCKLIVFSDDIDWAKKTLKFPEKTLFESGEDSISEKLFLMSSCKHFILSNSSFSWWAQEMSKSLNKIVVCPQFWYKDKRKCDIYKENWIRIN